MISFSQALPPTLPSELYSKKRFSITNEKLTDMNTVLQNNTMKSGCQNFYMFLEASE